LELIVLIGNGMLIDKVPITRLGMHWNAQLQPGRLPGATSSDNLGPLAALPTGYYNPHGWMLPRKGGSLRAGLVSGSGNAAASAQSGYNIDANVTGSGDVTTALLGLIVSILASISGSGGVTSATTEALTSLMASITGSGSATAIGQGLADLAAALEGEGAINPNNTALMDVAATIRGYSDLTPEGIRDNVWGALASSYNNAGTMGAKLNTASSGGVDLNALAEAVWEYVDRTLTAGGSSGATPEDIAAAILAAAQLAPIHADIQKVNAIEVKGTGTTSDPWNPVG
jgi:hypothetical protein